MPSTAIRGAEHEYSLTAGTRSAATIAFVHGWMLSRAYWQPAIALMPSNFQCLSYDLRGFGRSHLGPSQDFSPASYARDLEDLLDALHLGKVWLVGHSLGGIIALWAAKLLGDRVEGVICLNTGGGIYIHEEFEKFREAGKAILKVRPRWLPSLPFVAPYLSRDSVKRPLSASWGRQRAIDFVAAHYEAAIGTLLDSTNPERVHQLPWVVANLRQPIYFLAGADDRMMEPKYVHHLASFHPSFNDLGENVIELPDCGHMLMLEQTASLVRLLEQAIAPIAVNA